jgi:hypothetical protein
LEPDGASTILYESWNLQLAKKVGAMFKVYRKFSLKHFGIDPLEAVEKKYRKSNGDEDLDMP